MAKQPTWQTTRPTTPLESFWWFYGKNGALKKPGLSLVAVRQRAQWAWEYYDHTEGIFLNAESHGPERWTRVVPPDIPTIRTPPKRGDTLV